MGSFTCCGNFFLAIKPEEVQADLILEPEDQFYQAHADQCEYVDRSYYTDGSVDLWTAPNGRKKGSFPAGKRLDTDGGCISGL